jgi:hypothetical protein
MNILSFFTTGGVPASGLDPTIKIVEVASGNIDVSWLPMVEISDGWYKYYFSTYDYRKEYIVVCDGGDVLSDGERYVSSANDSSKWDIGKVVWDSQTSNHKVSGSFGELLQQTSANLKSVLGLVHENIFIDSPIYDDNNNLVSARLRIYSNSVDVGTNNNIIGTYLITSSGDGAGKFTSWSQVKI